LASILIDSHWHGRFFLSIQKIWEPFEFDIRSLHIPASKLQYAQHDTNPTMLDQSQGENQCQAQPTQSDGTVIIERLNPRMVK